jgi:hypothetical protein
VYAHALEAVEDEARRTGTSLADARDQFRRSFEEATSGNRATAQRVRVRPREQAEAQQRLMARMAVRRRA